jgi:hypothetical protein
MNEVQQVCLDATTNIICLTGQATAFFHLQMTFMAVTLWKSWPRLDLLTFWSTLTCRQERPWRSHFACVLSSIVSFVKAIFHSSAVPSPMLDNADLVHDGQQLFVSTFIECVEYYHYERASLTFK